MKRKAKAASEDDEEESEDDDEDESDADDGVEADDESDEDATPPRSVSRKRPAANAGKLSPANARVATKGGGKQRNVPPPVVHPPFRGWYSREWDPELFDQQVPMLDDLVELCVKLPDGNEGPGVVARVEYLESTDHFGTTAVMCYVDGNDNWLSEWASDFMRGGGSTDGGLVHFCRSGACHARNDEKTLVHCTRWKLLPPKPPVPGASRSAPMSGGLPLFGGASQAFMSGVDKARRDADGFGAKDERAVGGGQRAALPHGPRPPPLPPPGALLGGSRGDKPQAGQGGRKSTMDERLRERAHQAKPGVVDLERDQPPRKRHRKSRRRDRSGSGSESGSGPVCRGAPTIFKGSKFMQAAVMNEGSLLENGVQMMRKALAARQGGGGISSEMQDQLTALQGVVTNYLTVGLGPGAASLGKPLGLRNEREMRTLAESLDALLAGDLGRAGDILMQRFRACEVNLLDGDWNLAKHLELIPAHQITCVPNGMRQEMQREKRLADKLATGSGSSRRDRGDGGGG